MSDVDDLGRRFEILAGEVRDLVRWLKEDQAHRLAKIEDAIAVTRTELGGHAHQIADLKIDVHDHGKRLRALEARTTKRKARRP